jgi:hypothetical protein
MSGPSGAASEASLLAEMDSQDAAAQDYLKTFPLGADSSALEAWIGGFDQVESGYRRLKSSSAQLEQQGLPRARQRLDATLSDLAKARSTYVDTYNDTVRAEQLRFTDRAINNVANVRPDDISQVAATQLDISKQYYESVLRQVQAGFRWAVVAAATGLLFFIAAVGFVLVTNKLNAAIISAIGGGTVEVISGLNFWLYTKVAAQLDAFHVRLERMQRFILANSVAQSLTGKAKEAAISSLAQTIQFSSVEEPGVATHSHK